MSWEIVLMIVLLSLLALFCIGTVGKMVVNNYKMDKEIIAEQMKDKKR